MQSPVKSNIVGKCFNGSAEYFVSLTNMITIGVVTCLTSVVYSYSRGDSCNEGEAHARSNKMHARKRKKEYRE